MKTVKKYGAVLILLVILLGIVVSVSIWTEKESPVDGLAVRIMSADTEEEISAWTNENGEVFFFLPTYADLQTAQIVPDMQYSYFLNGEELKEGTICGDFQLDTRYSLAYTIWGRECETTLTFLQSDNVPAMHIDTKTGDMDYVHAKKGNEEEGTIRLYLPDGTVNYAGELRSIRGRGNATWQHEKRPYNISLQEEGQLLSMGMATKWVLLANASDKSNIRNKLVFDTAEQFGLAYSPDSEWVDLYLNGEYRGVYLLCEPNEIHEQRINIGTEDTFLVSLETESNMIVQNLPYIKTESGQCIRIRETAVDTEELLMIWQSIENAVFAGDGIDQETGKHYSELIDTDSLIRKYLLEEVFGNLDAFRASCFFYRNDLGQICAGPIWDYDKAMGNASDAGYNITNPDTLVVIREENWEGMGGQWIKQLAKKQEFNERCNEILETEIYPLFKQVVAEKVNEYVEYLANSHKMNWIRWYSADNYNSLSAEGDEIMAYLFDHLDFLQSIWINKDEYVTISFLGGANDAYYTVVPGGQINEIPVEQNTKTNRFVGWYYKDTNTPFDKSRPIYEDTVLFAQFEPTTVNLVIKAVKGSTVFLIAVIFLVLVCIEAKRISKGYSGKKDKGIVSRRNRRE